MKVAFIHLGYFIALIITSIVSFGIIFGAGFTRGIDLYTLFIPFGLSVLWNFAYVWQFLSMSSNKTHSVRPSKNWTFISMFLSGIFIVYSLFLTTWLLPIASAISVFLLLIWFALLFAHKKSKSSFSQIVYGSILFIVSVTFACLVGEYLITM